MTQNNTDVPLSISVDRISGTTSVLAPVGDVDTATTGQVRGVIAEEVGHGARYLVLDLSGVAFMGSSGLALLVEQREAAQRREGALRLAALPRPVARPLELTGLLELFDVYGDVDAAVADLPA